MTAFGTLLWFERINKMTIKPIRTEDDYDAALKELDRLIDARPGTPEYDQLEVLSILIEAYETEHYPIPLPAPIAAIEFHMERLGLTRKDLEPYIGSRARVSEILNRKRHLTLNMIRNLEKGLGIPAGVLIQEYELDRDANDEILEDPDLQEEVPITHTGFNYEGIVKSEPLWTDLPQQSEKTVQWTGFTSIKERFAQILPSCAA